MAHIDAEDVGAGLEQPGDDGALSRCRTQRGDDLGAPLPSHGVLFPLRGVAAGATPIGAAGKAALAGGFTGPAVGDGDCTGCSPDSVSWTVQARCSPVSTSKKPVRSKPRAKQSAMPRIVNSLSRVHMNA